ncbi:MAG: hypothetical protein LBR64_10560 [Dysgonamonadaceae bacterium]|jgi:TRAP-type C4-dicarboxylate transport system permease small subunit|nr:hypothetical protein [Dysgonamonadaceae bacterium]
MMKPEFAGKAATAILWICMAVTVALGAWFYYVLLSETGTGESPEISALIFWACLVPVIAFVAVAFFFVRYLIKNPRKAGKALIMPLALCLVLCLSLALGSGKVLPINGYDGSENTPFWLKITDMWIYAAYALLALSMLALVGGIFWSYIKKVR